MHRLILMIHNLCTITRWNSLYRGASSLCLHISACLWMYIQYTEQAGAGVCSTFSLRGVCISMSARYITELLFWHVTNLNIPAQEDEGLPISFAYTNYKLCHRKHRHERCHQPASTRHRSRLLCWQCTLRSDALKQMLKQETHQKMR